PERTAFGRSSSTWAADTPWSFGGFVASVRSSRRKKSGLPCRRAVRRLGAKASTPPYVPTSVRQSTRLSLVCRAGRRRQLEQGLGNGRSGDDHGGPGAERRRAKRGAAERRVLHG